MSRRIGEYEIMPIKDERGRYIYPDLKRYTFIADEAMVGEIEMVLEERHITYSTFARLAYRHYIDYLMSEKGKEM